MEALCSCSTAPLLGQGHFQSVLWAADSVLKGNSRETLVICPGQLVLKGFLQENSWLLQVTFLTVCQFHRCRRMTRFIRTGGRVCYPQCSSLCLAPSCQYASCNGTEALQLLFGQEKDISAYVTASIKSGNSSCGMCQPVPDVAFHMESTRDEGGSEERTKEGLCSASTADLWRALTRVHYICWSIQFAAEISETQHRCESELFIG